MSAMNTESIKKIAKEKFGKEVSDAQIQDFLSHNTVESEEELLNATTGLVGCGNFSKDDPPSVVEGNIRYFKLSNNGGFVVQMQVAWEKYKDIVENGCMMHKMIDSGIYVPSGYHDICVCGERIIDIKKDTPIPDGSEVYLRVVVSAGQNRIAQNRFTYLSTNGETAAYEIKGTTQFSKLIFKG